VLLVQSSEGVGVGVDVVLLVHEDDVVEREGRAAGVDHVVHDALGVADGEVRGHGEDLDFHLDLGLEAGAYTRSLLSST